MKGVLVVIVVVVIVLSVGAYFMFGSSGKLNSNQLEQQLPDEVDKFNQRSNVGDNEPTLIEVIKQILPTTERNTTPRAQCDHNELTGTEICCSDGQKIYYTFTGASDVPTGCFTPAKDVGTTCLQPHDCDSGHCILSLEEFYQYRQSGACKKNGIATHSCPDISGVCSEGRVEGGVFFISPGIIEQEILD
jgi:type II secretory pathway pseudopilin PulG